MKTANPKSVVDLNTSRRLSVPSRSRVAISVWTLSACLLSASVASATASYPATIRDELGLAAPPECTLCHDSLRGGIGTARSPFAESMKRAGLLGRGNEGTLFRALAQLTHDEVDSDQDGTPDVVELESGRSPNVADSSMGGGAGAPSDSNPPRSNNHQKAACSFEASDIFGYGGTWLALPWIGFSLRRRGSIQRHHR
jgi:hypothetical protein